MTSCEKDCSVEKDLLRIHRKYVLSNKARMFFPPLENNKYFDFDGSFESASQFFVRFLTREAFDVLSEDLTNYNFSSIRDHEFLLFAAYDKIGKKLLNESNDVKKIINRVITELYVSGGWYPIDTEKILNACAILVKYIDFDKLSIKCTTWFIRQAIDILDISDIPFDKINSASTWIVLINKYGNYSLDKFIENIGVLYNKTETREVIKTFPSIISKLNIDAIESSRLNNKEIVLMIGRDPVLQYAYSIRPEVKDYLKNSVTMDILSGSSKSSKILNKSLSLLDQKNR